MVKVLVVITTGFSQYGGLTSVMMNYLRFIDYTDLKVDILSANDPQQELIVECKTLNIKYIKLTGRKNNPIKYMLALKKILEKYDVVHVNANSATATLELISAKLAGVQRRIVHNHTGKCTHIIIHKMLLLVYRKLYTDAIACSKTAGDWIFGKGNYLILNNSINTEKYRYSKESRIYIREMYGISEASLVIGHIGKIYEPKNHKKILEIFKQIVNREVGAILFFVGDGEMRHEIEEYSKDLGINNSVIFAGMQKNTCDYLSAFDCFLFPSLWEGMPLALLEAQASGLQCVISDTIDSSAAMCETVKVNSLRDSNSKWAKDIISSANYNYNRNIASDRNILKICQNNYDVRKTANQLRKLYVK